MVVTRNCSKSDVKSWVEKRRNSFIAKDRTAKCQDCRQRLSDVKVIEVLNIKNLMENFNNNLFHV